MELLDAAVATKLEQLESAATIVTPGSALALKRAELDARRERNISERKLNRAFQTGSTFHWRAPTREERRSAPPPPRAKPASAESERLNQLERKRQAHWTAKATGQPPLEKPLREWSAEEVRGVLSIFAVFDTDGNGFIDEAELAALSEVMGVEATIKDADGLVKDGKIEPKEFFAFYVGCSPAEAAQVFTRHALIFADLEARSRPLKEWSKREVADVLDIFYEFDEDGSGLIDAKEFKALCEIMFIDEEDAFAHADMLTADGKIDPVEFFAFYVGCSPEEAEHAFEMCGWGKAL